MKKFDFSGMGDDDDLDDALDSKIGSKINLGSASKQRPAP